MKAGEEKTSSICSRKETGATDLKAVRRRESVEDAWGILSRKDARSTTPPIRWAISIR